jgi:hypothetical protein
MTDITPLQNYFTARELACRCGCGLINFHPGFVDSLLTLRRHYARPMIVTSACRCKKHNDTPAAQGGAGGVIRSLHVGDHAQYPGMDGGLAIDILAPDATERGNLFQVAWTLGWSIGWHSVPAFLHLDKRTLLRMSQTTFDY